MEDHNSDFTRDMITFEVQSFFRDSQDENGPHEASPFLASELV